MSDIRLHKLRRSRTGYTRLDEDDAGDADPKSTNNAQMPRPALIAASQARKSRRRDVYDDIDSEEATGLLAVGEGEEMDEDSGDRRAAPLLGTDARSEVCQLGSRA